VVATYVSAGIICAASLVLGRGILIATGLRAWSWTAPAVGFAALVVVCGAAVHLPGGPKAALVVALVLLAAALFYSRGSGQWDERVADAGLVSVVVLAAVSLPFVVNGRVGLLGVSVDNDLAQHLLFADALRPHGLNPFAASAGYPLGPHAVVLTIAQGTGMGLKPAFTGLLLAIPVLTSLTALAGLGRLPSDRRIAGAILVGLSYLTASYFAEGAFKETGQALLVLGFVLALRELVRAPGRVDDRRSAVPLALLAVAGVYTFSYPTLIWVVATVAGWIVLELVMRRSAPTADEVRSALRPVVPLVVAGLVVLAVVAAPEIGRLKDFFHQVGFSPAGTGAIPSVDTGNLSKQVSPYEALGIWPVADFRGSPQNVFYAGMLTGVALLAAAMAVLWWLRRRDLIPLGAALGSVGIYLLARAGGQSPYITAKALAIAAPLVMLVILRALLDPPRMSGRSIDARLARAALTIVFLGAATVSSYAAIRGAAVGPGDHGSALARLRPLVKGQPTLVLPYDDFAPYELRGAVVSVAAKPMRLPPDLRKRARPGAPLDFDSVQPRSLDRYRFVIGTAGGFASQAPPNWHRVAASGPYVLWKRSGRTADRAILDDEKRAPGALLDCGSDSGLELSRRSGEASVLPEPRLLPPGAWQLNESTPFPAPHDAIGYTQMEAGKSLIQNFRIPPGRWALSMAYTSPVPLTVGAEGHVFKVPANLDRPGALWPVGTFAATGRLGLFSVKSDRPSFFPVSQQVKIGPVALVRTPTARRQLVPLRAACGRYVDWYVTRDVSRSEAEGATAGALGTRGLTDFVHISCGRLTSIRFHCSWSASEVSEATRRRRNCRGVADVERKAGTASATIPSMRCRTVESLL
jgi:hypothetical protein